MVRTRGLRWAKRWPAAATERRLKAANPPRGPPGSRCRREPQRGGRHACKSSRTSAGSIFSGQASAAAGSSRHMLMNQCQASHRAVDSLTPRRFLSTHLHVYNSWGPPRLMYFVGHHVAASDPRSLHNAIAFCGRICYNKGIRGNWPRRANSGRPTVPPTLTGA